MFWSTVANGLIIGSVYCLVALGLTLVFGVLEIPDFNQGPVFMLGAFAVYFAVTGLGLPYLVAIPVAMVLVGLVGMVIGRLVYLRLLDRPHSVLLIAALGLLMITENGALILFGPEPRPLDIPYTGQVVQIGGAPFTVQRLLAFGVTLLAIWGLHIFLSTRTGRALRAVAEDRPVAALMGINFRTISHVTLFAASALSALAGGLLAPLFFVYPAMGTSIILKAFIVVVLGGLGSVPGAILGGWMLGLAETLSATYISSAWKDTFAFLILILVLLSRPTGLFTTRHGGRA